MPKCKQCGNEISQADYDDLGGLCLTCAHNELDKAQAAAGHDRGTAIAVDGAAYRYYYQPHPGSLPTLRIMRGTATIVHVCGRAVSDGGSDPTDADLDFWRTLVRRATKN
jgi:hypothetical protein